jgi:hypothetical protein
MAYPWLTRCAIREVSNPQSLTDCVSSDSSTSRTTCRRTSFASRPKMTSNRGGNA